MPGYKSIETNVIENELVDPHKWVERYADYLYTYSITRVNDEDQARDLVQETFLAALQKMDKFEGKCSERTWLTAIIKNKIIDIYRKKSSGLLKITDNIATGQEDDFFNHTDGHWKEAHSPRDINFDPHDPLIKKEFNRILQKCMQKLPALWLSVFTMKHMDDELTEVICSELKVTPSNFWVIIHRAKLNLRACLQKNWT